MDFWTITILNWTFPFVSGSKNTKELDVSGILKGRTISSIAAAKLSSLRSKMNGNGVKRTLNGISKKSNENFSHFLNQNGFLPRKSSWKKDSFYFRFIIVNNFLK